MPILVESVGTGQQIRLSFAISFEAGLRADKRQNELKLQLNFFHNLVILECWKTQFADEQNQSFATASLVWIFERLRMEEQLLSRIPELALSHRDISASIFLS
jgi:hypothetical protein